MNYSCPIISAPFSAVISGGVAVDSRIAPIPR